MNKLAAPFGVVLVLAAGAVAVLYMNLGSLTRTAIVEALSYVLEVDVTLEKVDLALSEGDVTLHHLRIGNPEGYSRAEAFHFPEIAVTLDVASITSDLPTLRLIRMRKPDVTLEPGMKSNNLRRLVESASRFETEGGLAEETDASMPVRIERLEVEGSSVTVASKILPTDITFDLAPFEMTNIGTEEKAATVSEAVSLFVKKMLVAAVKGSTGKLPAQLASLLDGDVKETAKELVQGLSEGVTETAEKAKDRIKGLFKRGER